MIYRIPFGTTPRQMQRDATFVIAPVSSRNRIPAPRVPVNTPNFLESFSNNVDEIDSLFPGWHPIQNISDAVISTVFEAPREFAKGNYVKGLWELLQFPGMFSGAPIPLAPERSLHEAYMKNKELYDKEGLNMKQYEKPYSNILDERSKKTKGKK